MNCLITLTKALRQNPRYHHSLELANRLSYSQSHIARVMQFMRDLPDLYVPEPITLLTLALDILRAASVPLTTRQIARRLNTSPTYCQQLIRQLRREYSIDKQRQGVEFLYSLEKEMPERLETLCMEWERTASAELARIQQILAAGEFETSQDFYMALDQVLEAVLTQYGTMPGYQRYFNDNLGEQDEY